jgi:hypothetical protein
LRLDGIDPPNHRERPAKAAEAERTAAAIEAAKTVTFAQVAAEVIAKERSKWKSQSMQEFDPSGAKPWRC